MGISRIRSLWIIASMCGVLPWAWAATEQHTPLAVQPGGLSSVRIPLVELTLPSVHAGCGGIDWHKGGLSFIGKQAFQDVLQHIQSNATAFAMHVATEETMPIVANVVKYLQDQASKANHASMQACELGEALTGNVVSRVRAEAQMRCAQWALKKGWFGSWAEAKQACGPGGRFAHIMQSAHRTPSTPWSGDHNVTWELLKELAPETGSVFRHLVMGIVGTLIIQEQSQQAPRVHIIPGRGNDGSLLDVAVRGGTVQVPQCADASDRCMRPHLTGFLKVSDDQAVLPWLLKEWSEILQKRARIPAAEMSDTQSRLLAQVPVALLGFKHPDKAVAEQIAYYLVRRMVWEMASRIEQALIHRPMRGSLYTLFLQDIQRLVRQLRPSFSSEPKVGVDPVDWKAQGEALFYR